MLALQSNTPVNGVQFDKFNFNSEKTWLKSYLTDIWYLFNNIGQSAA